jgi:HTH-type transcriptional regulator/antitoxin HipB
MTDFDLSGLLRRARRTAHLSQRELAARAGVAPSTVARAELATGEMLFSTILRLFAAAGMRLTVHDDTDVELVAMRTDGLRDRAGRRYAAHLDPEPTHRDGWQYYFPSRYYLPPPIAAQERRTHRDERRTRHGTPTDHPPGPAALYRRQPHRPPTPAPAPAPVPDCACGPECERQCLPQCHCQCEPPTTGLAA